MARAKTGTESGSTGTKKRGREALSKEPAIAFVQVAEPLVSKLIDSIERLQGLASKPKKYEFNKDQAAEIFGTLQAALDGAKKAYESPPKAIRQGKFSFSK